jgi:hypothetical protein
VARFLAVAHQTSEADEFIEAVRQAAGGDPKAEFVLLVPATPVEHLAGWTEGEAHAVAADKAAAARRRLEATGVNVVDARVGDPRPYDAIMDALADEHFDAVIVSTFPPGMSRWLGMDLINRLRRSTALPITHVIAH